MKKISIIDKIYSKKTISKIKNKIELLGDDCKYDEKEFLNIRLLGTILIFISFILFSKNGYIYAPLFSIMYYFLINYILY